MLRLLLLPLLLLQFTSVDRLFRDAKYPECEQALQQMMPQASPGKESAEVLWRLSRVNLLLGDAAPDVKTKREFYAVGLEYAERAIEEDPTNPEGYMWHSGNIGRDCNTRSLPEQAKASAKVSKDLNIILNRLGKVGHSSAWHAMAEYYWRHPFKSNDSAINFARRSVATIPSDEIRIVSCLLLADMLQERNWSAEKRASEAASNAEKFKRGKTNTDKYAFYDGSSPRLPWLEGSLTGMSDREEAATVVRYAKERYETCSDIPPAERAEYKNLLNWIKKNL